MAAAVLAMLPDADTLAFGFVGRDAAYEFHRGPAHSLLFALFAGGLATLCLFRDGGWRMWLFLAAVTASHGILDAFTDGGLGVEFLWPFGAARTFWPWTPIEVAPISLRAFFGEWGVRCLLSEALWVWLPVGAMLAAVEGRRRVAARSA